MGGRGGSAGGGIKGIEIRHNGTTQTFRSHNGQITDMNKTGTRNTNGLSLNQLQQKAKSLGWEVKTYNSKQLKQYDSNRKSERAKSSRQLDNILAKARTTAKVHKGK